MWRSVAYGCRDAEVREGVDLKRFLCEARFSYMELPKFLEIQPHRR